MSIRDPGVLSVIRCKYESALKLFPTGINFSFSTAFVKFVKRPCMRIGARYAGHRRACALAPHKYFMDNNC